MGALTIQVADNRESDGPAMSCLTDQQHLFVQVLTTTVGKGGQPDPQRAGVAAGYTKQSAYNLMRNPRILAAVREEAAKRLQMGALIGVNVMLEIASSTTHKDQFSAAKHLAKLNGFVEVQKVEVEHRSESQEAMVARVIANAKVLGLDPRELLGQAGVVIDAEFTVVEPAEVDEWSVP